MAFPAGAAALRAVLVLAVGLLGGPRAAVVAFGLAAAVVLPGVLRDVLVDLGAMVLTPPVEPPVDLRAVLVVGLPALPVGFFAATPALAGPAGGGMVGSYELGE